MSYAKGYGVNKTTREYIDEFNEKENTFANQHGSVFQYAWVKNRLIVRQLSNAAFEDVVLFDGECNSFGEFYKIMDSLKFDEKLSY